MAWVRNIGLPVNDSERKAIEYLSRELPTNNILLTNLELPTLNGFPYEYDIIVIGDFAVYVIEIKGYKGEIKGNAYEWELSSGKIYKSPIPLLNTKARIVGTRIQQSSILSSVRAVPLLLLTDDQVSVNVQDPFAPSIVKLEKAAQIIRGDPRRPADITSPMKAKIEEMIAKQFLPLKRDKEIGDYRILEQINRNDLYTTFIGEHKLLGGNNRYILKVYTLKIYADDEEQKRHRNRILREAKTLSGLPPHPNLVRPNPPFPEGDDKIVLPLEWVDGHSLRGLVDDPATIKTIPVKNVLLGLCTALTYVHQHGVVHRDVRPDNVIVCPNGTMRLVNFDCAHLSGNDTYTIATRLGRQLDERYVAPEVWIDPATASIQSDIYSLGIIFHELLTGRTPYLSIKGILKSQKIESKIRALRPDIDQDAERLFLSMCAFDPAARISDLSDVRDWIEMLVQ
jgi:tRNA A-37 threonylcarbamoyl transferase component Bud32